MTTLEHQLLRTRNWQRAFKARYNMELWKLHIAHYRHIATKWRIASSILTAFSTAVVVLIADGWMVRLIPPFAGIAVTILLPMFHKSLKSCTEYYQNWSEIFTDLENAWFRGESFGWGDLQVITMDGKMEEKIRSYQKKELLVEIQKLKEKAINVVKTEFPDSYGTGG